MSRRLLSAVVTAVAVSVLPVTAASAVTESPAASGMTASVAGSVSKSVPSAGEPRVHAVRGTVSTPTVRPTLRTGSRGAAVTTLQRRLGALGYWVGTPTGRYDHATAQAVMALQKVAGLPRDAVAGRATWAALDRGVRPSARSTRGRVTEIDLRRQILIVAVDGKVRAVVNTSTGTSRTPTPRGRYTVTRQINAWRTAPLGRLYRPKYFHRGYAVHGVNDGHIPGRPASHGCARVSMKAMDMLWGPGGLRVGDAVWVY